MGHMHIGHEQIVIAEDCFFSRLGGSVNRHTFANTVSVANEHFGRITSIFQVLRFLPHRSMGKKFVVAANAGMALDYYVGTETSPFPNLDIRSINHRMGAYLYPCIQDRVLPNHSIGTDHHRFMDISFGVNHCSWVDSGSSRGVSV
jgi:hypothetical protein